jgi:ribosome maturation factor RimP
MKTKEEIVEKITSIVEPFVNALHMELIDVEYHTGHRKAIVRIFVEKENGINVDECAQVSRLVERELDEVIPGGYILEVSSPGLDRELKKKKEFIRYKGRLVKIATKLPMKRRKNFKGRLGGVVDDDVIVYDNKNDEEIRIPLSEIKKAKLVPEIKF